MKQKLWLILCASLMLFVAGGNASSSPQKQEGKAGGRETPVKISTAQAIRIAEKFVARNGYTDLPPTKDKSKLSYESIEFEGSIEKMLKFRRNTLERKAYGFLWGKTRGGRGEKGWTVAFLYKDRDKAKTPETGRAVTMNEYGKNLRMQHVDIFLKRLKKPQLQSRENTPT